MGAIDVVKSERVLDRAVVFDEHGAHVARVVESDSKTRHAHSRAKSRQQHGDIEDAPDVSRRQT